jgi:hypothetical protein
MQERMRKYVKSCFGVLKSCFDIMQNMSRLWQMDTVYGLMIASMIVHNMIIDDKRAHNLEPFFILKMHGNWGGNLFSNIHGRHSKARKFLITFQFEIKLSRTLVDHEGPTLIWLKKNLQWDYIFCNQNPTFLLICQICVANGYSLMFSMAI